MPSSRPFSSARRLEIARLSKWTPNVRLSLSQAIVVKDGGYFFSSSAGSESQSRTRPRRCEREEKNDQHAFLSLPFSLSLSLFNGDIWRRTFDHRSIVVVQWHGLARLAQELSQTKRHGVSNCAGVLWPQDEAFAKVILGTMRLVDQAEEAV